MKKLPIKIILVSLLAVIVTACSPAYEYRQDRITTNISVPIGKTVVAGSTGLSVMFNSVEQDSRCPINAKCAWAGVGIVNATVINATGVRKSIKLSTINYEKFNKKKKLFGKEIELIDLLPQPVAGAKPEISQKLIKLKID